MTRMMMAAVLMALVATAPAMAQIAGTGAAQTGDCPGGKGTLQNIITEHAFTDVGTDHGNPSPLIVLKTPLLRARISGCTSAKPGTGRQRLPLARPGVAPMIRARSRSIIWSTFMSLRIGSTIPVTALPELAPGTAQRAARQNRHSMHTRPAGLRSAFTARSAIPVRLLPARALAQAARSPTWAILTAHKPTGVAIVPPLRRGRTAGPPNGRPNIFATSGRRPIRNGAILWLMHRVSRERVRQNPRTNTQWGAKKYPVWIATPERDNTMTVLSQQSTFRDRGPALVCSP